MMTNEGQEESAVHKIKVDEHTELRLTIPIELDAMEFTSILERSRKILKVSEISVAIPKRKGNNTTAEQDEILRRYDECSSIEDKRALADDLGTTLGRLQARISYYKMKAKNPETFVKKEDKRKRKKVFPDAVVDKMKKMIKDGVPSSMIAKKLGLKNRQVYDKISYMRSHGEL